MRKPDMAVRIRKEQPGDEQAVYAVNFLAFGRESEPILVDLLRTDCPEGISLVAERKGRIIGHILFTPAQIEGDGQGAEGMGLAPMSVLPECQGKGVGSALVREGLTAVEGTKALFVAVLGHPWFYPKFGFAPASGYGVGCPFDGVPDEAFMIRVFDPKAFRGVRGVVRMRPEFSSTR